MFGFTTEARTERGAREREAEGIPAPVRHGLELSVTCERALALACRMFVTDAHDPNDDDSCVGRFERAVARAMLDAWQHGLGSGEAVGSAYAALANQMVLAEATK